jgi:hypothetical protein
LPIPDRPRCRSAIRSISASSPAVSRSIHPLSRLSGEAAAYINARHSSDHATSRVPEQTIRITQIPITSADTSQNNPRVRSLAASGRRPGYPRPRLAWPASGTLHKTRIRPIPAYVSSRLERTFGRMRLKTHHARKAALTPQNTPSSIRPLTSRIGCAR